MLKFPMSTKPIFKKHELLDTRIKAILLKDDTCEKPPTREAD